MCQSRNSTKVKLKNGKIVKVDKCIAKLIEIANEWGGAETVSSCCGHGRYPHTVGYRGSKQINLPRKRKFYKKDKNGYYFIPETLKMRK